MVVKTYPLIPLLPKMARKLMIVRLLPRIFMIWGM
ncbi:NS7b protein [Bottlenose dolphin coronavirus HKU22]|uniref:NS7b protein n=1 Tax=Bottlenose dolphin coronavirus HKU22 TaxID=1433215 RepID=V5TH07_BWCOV|nr:NS7b protein [Bottlenose dolphin coronavirus HKU22]AHB63516.1 NS7b protein [Bottlenose dolphin coronavirus HKU22]